MRSSRLVLILAAFFLVALISAAARAEVSANPFGFAVFVEDEPVENDIVLTNNGDEAVGFECKFRSVRREDEGRLGPRRDEPGETLGELQLRYAYSVGFAWDAENEIMYATHTTDGHIVGYAWNGEEITDITTDFVTQNIPAASPVEVAYYDGVLYTFYWGQSTIYRYDVEGNQLESIVREWNDPNGNLVYGCGLAVDPEAGYLYMSGIVANDAGPSEIKVYDINDDYTQVGHMTGFQDISENHNTDVRNRLNWVPEHTDGHLWIFQRDPDGEAGAGPYWPPYAAWQVNVIPNEDDIEWDWELVQHFQVESDAWSNGIGHDGVNLWIGNRDSQLARIVDDGIVEQSWLTVEPMEGEIGAGEELVLATSAEAGEREPGVYELELRLRLTDPEQPEIRMTVIMSYETLTGDIHGQIIDPTIGDGEPAAGIKVDLEGYRMTRWTDEEGRFAFDWLPMDDYVLHITGEGYLPQVAEATLEQGNEQANLEIELEHSEFALSVQDVFEALAPGDNIDWAITGSNAGNGLLTYTTERHLAGGADVPPWTLRVSHHVAAMLEDNYIQGAVFIDGEFYVAGQHNRTPLIYVLDRDGNQARTFAQVGPDNRGMNDMTWDGHRIWGISGAVTIGFTTEGEEIVRFNAPMALGKNIAWDEANGCLWISGTTTDVFAVSPEGQQIRSLDALYLGEQLRMYGLDCYPDDPTGHTLYIFCKERDTDRSLLVKMNPADGDIQFCAYLDHEEAGSPMGICLTNQYDIYSWVMVAVCNNTPAAGGDRVDVWQIDARRDWFRLNPEAGEIEAGGEQEFTLTLSAVNMVPEEYEGDITFYHDGRGGQTLLPVHLSVREGQVPSQRTLQLARGWNMVSVNLQPEPADDIRALTRELVDDNNLLLMKDGIGRFYNPEYDFCNIPGWDVAQGYMIKVDRDGSLTLAGMTVMADEPIALADGWQIVAYYPRVPVDAVLGFSGIVDQLILAKDVVGHFYNPEWEFSNMGNLMEGQGYQLKMDGAAELIYRLREGGNLLNNYELGRLPEHVNTGENMSLLVLAEGMDGREVGVYADGALVGSGVVSGGRCGIAVWGDDLSTAEVDGATEDATLTLTILREGIETSLAPEILSGELRYQTDAFAVVNVAAGEIPTEFGLTSVYPNPFNGATRLGYCLDEAGSMSLKVFDLNGRLAATLASGDRPAGAYATIWDASAMPSGLYLARLESGSRTATAKLMLVK